MSKLTDFLKTLPNPKEFASFGVYEKSYNQLKDDHIFIIKEEGNDLIVVTGSSMKNFKGEKRTLNQLDYLIAQTDHDNINALRNLFPYMKPKPVLREKRSFGLGDRLGLAGEGHLKALLAYDAYPVLAQQSMRELTLTNRTYSDVLDAASLAVYKMGYKRGFGADGDHLKTEKDIKYALDTGFTMITLDTSDHIRNDVESLSIEQIDQEVNLTENDKKKYLNKTFNIQGHQISFTELELKKAILIYQDSIEYTTHIYHQFFKGNQGVDLELSIDETATKTELNHHLYIANELAEKGVHLTTIAPRFHGEFQKGIDYIGNTHIFQEELKVHVAIAEHYGYKLSIHSGSDKFSIFEIIGKETKGHFHVKTAGTNWLVAAHLVAIKDPSLYREIHQKALDTFEQAKKLYHVTTHIENIPAIDQLSDEELPKLFENNDARQLIHITYGYILNDKNNDGTYKFKDRLYHLWTQYSDLYATMLKEHIGKHLELLYKGF